MRSSGSSQRRPYHSLTDFWHRAQVSRPIAERLVLAGGFDSLYGLGSPLGGLAGVRRRTQVTRRDLLLQVAELDRHARAVQRAGRARGLAAGRGPRTAVRPADTRADQAAERASTDPSVRDAAAPVERHALATPGVWARAAAQSRAAADPRPVTSVQLTLDLGDEPQEHVSGLPEMSPEERMRAELEILGLDASRHVVDTYADFLDALGAVRSRDLLTQRSRAEILVAGVKVATQTPPVRSGRRVVFLTLDDGTGPVDATFFEDVQGPYAATVFGSWLLVVRGELRRTGHRGVSLRATGAWSLPELHALWGKPGPDGGIEAVRAQLAAVSTGRGGHPPPGAGALQRLPDVSLRRRQAGRRGRQGRGPEAVAPQPREPRMSTTPRPRPPASSRLRDRHPTINSSREVLVAYIPDEPSAPGPGSRQRRPAPRLAAMAPPASERRGSTRTAVVWSALEPVLAHGSDGRLDVLDIGGGTGGLAVRIGELGHRVTVVDPSPDALAALDRRAREHDVAVTGRQGDLSSLLDVAGPDSADLVLCHGVLEVVDDPAAALATLARVVRPGGVLSLLVAQRYAAVVARAMAGHFQQALDDARPDDRLRTTRHGPAGPGRTPLHPRRARRAGARRRAHRRCGAGHPGVHRPRARFAARPRARCHRGAGRAGAGRGLPAGVPPAGHPAPPARPPVLLSGAPSPGRGGVAP